MAEDLYDPNTFMFEFPLWALVHPTAPSGGPISINGAAGQKGLAMFTDEDLANRFRNSAPPLGH